MLLKKSIDFFIHNSLQLSLFQYHRARNVVCCCLLLLIAMPVFSIFYYKMDNVGALLTLASSGVFIAVLSLVKYTDKLQLAGNLIIITLYFLFHWLMQRQSGILFFPAYWIILIPILAILLIGIASSIFWAIVSLATVIGYFIFNNHFQLITTNQHDLLLLRVASIISLLLIVYCLTYFFEVGKKQHLESLQALVTQQSLMMTYIINNLIEQKKIEKNLIYLAHYDALTGLPNRVLYEIILHNYILKADKNNSKIFLFYFDLDNFKDINNTLGHAIGDLYLNKIGKVLKKNIPKNAVVCRLGGDEFICILEHIRTINEASIVAKKLIQICSEPIPIKKYQIALGSSVGIAIYPDHGKDTMTLTKSADIAMYHAKNNGKRMYRFYNQELSRLIQHQSNIENHLQTALKNGEFYIEYQPQYDTRIKKISGIEALLRWNNPILGPVNPETFIPIAEKIGLITVLGEWVLKNACEQFKKWQQANLVHKFTKIAVNLSIIQLEQVDFLENVTDIIRNAGVDPKYVELELTESIIIASEERMLAILRQLDKLGVSIAIDDFGTGYSSFSRLKNYPLKVLKMDKSFLYGMAENNKNIIKSVLSLAHSLNLIIIAEGVESEEQYQFLKESDCNYMQGFYLCPPCDAITMTEHLNSLKQQDRE